MPLLKLGVDYLPSIFISVVNFVLPPMFKLIAPLEGYTRSRQIILILLRFQPFGVGWIRWWGGLVEGRWFWQIKHGNPEIWDPIRSGFKFKPSLPRSLSSFICKMGRFVSTFCTERPGTRHTPGEG